MLLDLLKEKYVRLGVKASDWREATRLSLAPLLESGAVTQEYVDDVITGAEQHGPYFVVTPRVALPHARPECGALEDALGVTVLDKSVEFGSADNDPVRYLFPLSATSASGHLDALASLVELLSDEDFFAVLDEASSPKEVVDAVRNAERSN